MSEMKTMKTPVLEVLERRLRRRNAAADALSAQAERLRERGMTMAATVLEGHACQVRKKTLQKMGTVVRLIQERRAERRAK